MALILTGVAIFTGVVLALVALILLARKSLVASGNVTISINGQKEIQVPVGGKLMGCLLYTSPSPRDGLLSRMPSSA